jgi:hypothetical protein
MALSAPVDRRCWNDRVPQQCHRFYHKLGLPSVQSDRVRTRIRRLRRDQQCKHSMVRYIHHIAGCWNILRRCQWRNNLDVNLFRQLVRGLSQERVLRDSSPFHSYSVSSSGTFSATVPARSAIAIYIGQKITGPATTTSTTPTSIPTSTSVQVTFAPTVSTVYGENVFVAGSIPQLGNWATGSAVSIQASSSHGVF